MMVEERREEEVRLEEYRGLRGWTYKKLASEIEEAGQRLMGLRRPVIVTEPAARFWCQGKKIPKVGATLAIILMTRGDVSWIDLHNVDLDMHGVPVEDVPISKEEQEGLALNILKETAQAGN